MPFVHIDSNRRILHVERRARSGLPSGESLLEWPSSLGTIHIGEVVTLDTSSSTPVITAVSKPSEYSRGVLQERVSEYRDLVESLYPVFISDVFNVAFALNASNARRNAMRTMANAICGAFAYPLFGEVSISDLTATRFTLQLIYDSSNYLDRMRLIMEGLTTNTVITGVRDKKFVTARSGQITVWSSAYSGWDDAIATSTLRRILERNWA